MRYTKKLLVVIIALILLTDTVLADYQVTLYPGIKYLHLNPSNSDLFMKDLKTGKDVLLYTPERIKNRIKHQLFYMTAIEASTKNDTNYISDISKIQKKFQGYTETTKNYVDPFYLLGKLFATFANSSDEKTVNDLKAVFGASIGTMIDQISAALKSPENITSKNALFEIMILPIINNAVKEIANQSATILHIDVSKSPLYSYLMSKLGDGIVIAVTAIINIHKNQSLVGALSSDEVKIVLKEGVTKGVLSYIAVVPAFVEGFANIMNSINIVMAMTRTMQATKRILYKELLVDFIGDYTLKYNMNIIGMANNSIYNKKHPDDFLETFIYYLMTHNSKGRVDFKNSYISNANVVDSSSSSYSVGAFMYNLISFGRSRNIKINLNNSDDIKDLTKLARLALTLIEKYGDGGNNKIFLTYSNDKNGKMQLQINPNSYKVMRLYWMPEKDFYYSSYVNSDEWLFNYYDNIATPYTIYNGRWKVSSVLESSDHINIEYKDASFVDGKYLQLKGFKKVINYNGFMGNDYSKYPKIVTIFPSVFLPNYNLVKYFSHNNKVDSYIRKLFLWDIIPIKYLFNDGRDLKKYLSTPITATDLFLIFKKFENNVQYSHTDLKTAYIDTLKSPDSLLTRKVLFKFLDEYLKLGSKNLTKIDIVHNGILKIINTTDWTIEGFDLALNGVISFGTKMKPNNRVTMFTMLFVLMNIENHLRTQK